MPPNIIKIKIILNHLFFKIKEIKEDATKVVIINNTINEIGWELAQKTIPKIKNNLITENSIKNI